MKMATKVVKTDMLRYQLIIEGSNVLGVNIIYNRRILEKKRFNFPIQFSSKEDETSLVDKIMREYLIK